MSHLLQLLLLIAVMIVAAKLAGAASNRLGQPAVFGELLVGLVLGPTALNLLGWPVFGGTGGATLLPVVRDLSEIGVILLMFIAGLETDLGELRRVGHVAFWAAAGGVVLPLAAGAGVAVAFGMPLFWEGIFIGTILTATSVSITAQTLMEIGALRSREGTVILGAAVIDDVMGIVVLSLVVAFARTEGGVDPVTLALVFGRMVAYFTLAVLAGTAFEAIGRRAQMLGVSQGLLGIVLVVVFLYAWAAEFVGGVAAITGAYLAGVLFSRTSFKSRIDAGIHPLTYSMLVPVFFVGIGLQANGRQLGGYVGFTHSPRRDGHRDQGGRVRRRRAPARLREDGGAPGGRRNDLAGGGGIDRRQLRPGPPDYQRRRVLGGGDHGPGDDDGHAAAAAPDVPQGAAAAAAGRRGDGGRPAGRSRVAGFRTESARPGRPSRRCCR